MGVAALVLGIIGAVFSIIPGMFWLAIILGIVALVLGILGRRQAVAAQLPTGSATAGIVLGGVALALSLFWWIMCAAVCTGAGALHGLGRYATTPPPAEPAPASGAPIQISPKKLVQTFETEDDATAGFNGKLLEVTGSVEEVAMGGAGNYYVALFTGERLKLKVWFDRDDGGQVAALKKGQVVTVRGQSPGKNSTEVALFHSTLVE
jgi:hypothetical protein